MKTAKNQASGHKVVSREEWLAARTELLKREKELTRLRDEQARQRRELPWVKVEKNYVFDTPEGKRTLSQLFDDRSQLIVYHFMFGPDWAEGCPSCSFVSDHFDGALAHLAARDVTLAVVSRAPLPKIEAFKKRMGWRFKWVSSQGSDFNHDYQASTTADERAKGEAYYNYRTEKASGSERAGISVFCRDDDGTIYHTYSCYARGLDMMNAAYHYLDLLPKGRDEDGLSYPQSWVRLHDEYAR